MKKCMLIALITIFTLSVVGTLCFAQVDRTVTNTSKKGSLVIWPLVKAETEAVSSIVKLGSGGVDTIIKLSNDFYLGVKVKCSYRYVSSSKHVDWVFTLLPNQVVTWVASTGAGVGLDYLNVIDGSDSPPQLTGEAELRCWAVNDGKTQQIAWNWLSGEAIVQESSSATWEYSAWRFAVNSSTTGANAGMPGQILLTGDSGNYDACPTALLFNFLKQAPPFSEDFRKGTVNSGDLQGTVNNVLTLVPCGEDFKNDVYPTSYAELVTRDEFRNLSSGTWVCVEGDDPDTQWFSESLTSYKLHIPVSSTLQIPLSSKLTFSDSNPFVDLATPAGSITIHGKKNLGSCPKSIGMPLLGVMSMQFSSGSGIFVGETPTAVGPGQAYVRDALDNNTVAAVVMYWR